MLDMAFNSTHTRQTCSNIHIFFYQKLKNVIFSSPSCSCNPGKILEQSCSSFARLEV
uniref:Uncharacterized protein n=1 Tax=Arundo donax TaxID=35708 RepID=A0A0A8Z6W1_ARUDO